METVFYSKLSAFKLFKIRLPHTSLFTNTEIPLGMLPVQAFSGINLVSAAK